MFPASLLSDGLINGFSNFAKCKEDPFPHWLFELNNERAKLSTAFENFALVSITENGVSADLSEITAVLSNNHLEFLFIENGVLTARHYALMEITNVQVKINELSFTVNTRYPLPSNTVVSASQSTVETLNLAIHERLLKMSGSSYRTYKSSRSITSVPATKHHGMDDPGDKSSRLDHIQTMVATPSLSPDLQQCASSSKYKDPLDPPDHNSEPKITGSNVLSDICSTLSSADSADILCLQADLHHEDLNVGKHNLAHPHSECRSTTAQDLKGHLFRNVSEVNIDHNEMGDQIDLSLAKHFEDLVVRKSHVNSGKSKPFTRKTYSTRKERKTTNSEYIPFRSDNTQESRPLAQETALQDADRDDLTDYDGIDTNNFAHGKSMARKRKRKRLTKAVIVKHPGPPKMVSDSHTPGRPKSKNQPLIYEANATAKRLKTEDIDCDIDIEDAHEKTLSGELQTEKSVDHGLDCVANLVRTEPHAVPDVSFFETAMMSVNDVHASQESSLEVNQEDDRCIQSTNIDTPSHETKQESKRSNFVGTKTTLLPPKVDKRVLVPVDEAEVDQLGAVVDWDAQITKLMSNASSPREKQRQRVSKVSEYEPCVMREGIKVPEQQSNGYAITGMALETQLSPQAHRGLRRKLKRQDEEKLATTPSWATEKSKALRERQTSELKKSVSVSHRPALAEGRTSREVGFARPSETLVDGVDHAAGYTSGVGELEGQIKKSLASLGSCGLLHSLPQFEIHGEATIRATKTRLANAAANNYVDTRSITETNESRGESAVVVDFYDGLKRRGIVPPVEHTAKVAEPIKHGDSFSSSDLSDTDEIAMDSGQDPRKLYRRKLPKHHVVPLYPRFSFWLIFVGRHIRHFDEID